MRKVVLALILLIAPIVTYSYTPQKGDFGAGLILGEPTGLTVKYFLQKQHAIDAALGYSVFDKGFSMVFDYAFHIWDVFSKKGNIPIYFGPGIQIQERKFKNSDSNNSGTSKQIGMGIRGFFGTEFHPDKYRFSFFLEVSLHIFLVPSVKAGFGLGGGARYYF